MPISNSYVNAIVQIGYPKHFGLSFAYDAPMIWNDLPDEVRSANSLASFRSKLKSYLFGKTYPP